MRLPRDLMRLNCCSESKAPGPPPALLWQRRALFWKESSVEGPYLLMIGCLAILAVKTPKVSEGDGLTPLSPAPCRQ
jgi:hypothetical protein